MRALKLLATKTIILTCNGVDGIPLPTSHLDDALRGVGMMTQSSFAMLVDMFPKPLAMCASSRSDIKLSKIAMSSLVNSTSLCKVGPCIEFLNEMFP